jgi:HKD family nuclease
MTTFSNSSFDRKLKNRLEELLRQKDCNEFVAATGYFGMPSLSSLEALFLRIAKKGKVKIILGMYYHAGLSEKKHQFLSQLHEKLYNKNSASGVFITRFEYHGKIYKISNDTKQNIFVGSSNFSDQGWSGRTEFNIELTEKQTKENTTRFLSYLCDHDQVIPLHEVNIKSKKKSTQKFFNKNDLENYEIDEAEFFGLGPPVGNFEFRLRVDNQPKSSLNLFFDKGRKDSSGRYAPRPWYEIELTADTKTLKNPLYPKSIPVGKSKTSKARKGNFTGYIKDQGKIYKLQMKVHADNGKNISTADEVGGRATLGRILKGKLERSGALQQKQRINSDTLIDFGRDTLTFKKIDDKNYILDFDVN